MEASVSEIKASVKNPNALKARQVSKYVLQDRSRVVGSSEHCGEENEDSALTGRWLLGFTCLLAMREPGRGLSALSGFTRIQKLEFFRVIWDIAWQLIQIYHFLK